MNAVTQTIGQAVAAAVVAGALLLGGMSAPDADAKPNKDTRPMAVKINELKEGCETTGGSFNTSTMANDHGTVYTDCEGGGKPTVNCVLTPTTGECFPPPKREAPRAGTPESLDGTDLRAMDATSGGKQGGHGGKKSGKGRK
jgi:hypothetical protein